jgi:hypothetical protein
MLQPMSMTSPLLVGVKSSRIRAKRAIAEGKQRLTKTASIYDYRLCEPVGGVFRVHKLPADPDRRRQQMQAIYSRSFLAVNRTRLLWTPE